MAAYSMDLRKRVVRACDDGMPAAAVATRCDVSLARVYRVLQRRRETGSIAPRKQTQSCTTRAATASSTNQGAPPTWCAATGAVPAASACGITRRVAIGRPTQSWRVCASMDSPRQPCSTARSTGRAARPRRFDQVIELLAIALALFSPSECLNFVQHGGYPLCASQLLRCSE